MLTDTEKAYYKAMLALKEKDYPMASGFFRTAENQFAENLDFRILQAVTKLHLALREEIIELENSQIEIEEFFSDGKETEFRG